MNNRKMTYEQLQKQAGLMDAIRKLLGEGVNPIRRALDAGVDPSLPRYVPSVRTTARWPGLAEFLNGGGTTAEFKEKLLKQVPSFPEELRLREDAIPAYKSIIDATHLPSPGDPKATYGEFFAKRDKFPSGKSPKLELNSDRYATWDPRRYIIATFTNPQDPTPRHFVDKTIGATGLIGTGATVAGVASAVPEYVNPLHWAGQLFGKTWPKPTHAVDVATNTDPGEWGTSDYVTLGLAAGVPLAGLFALDILNRKKKEKKKQYSDLENTADIAPAL